MRRALDVSNLELNETIVSIRRVAKTVKGGRNMRFSVTVVVGDGEGHVGVGLGKALEIPEAVRKATEDAKKNVILVPTVGTTIPHRQLGIFGAGKVLLMPAAPGTGVIAGSSVRTVLEAAGVKVKTLHFGKFNKCVKVGYVAVNTAVRQKSVKVKFFAVYFCILDCTQKFFIGKEIAVGYRLSDSSKFLVNDSTCTHV